MGDIVERLQAYSSEGTIYDEAADTIARLREENERLKAEVVTFCGMWAEQYARQLGLPEGHLHPAHYDILERAGARMDDFTRAALKDTGQ